MATKILSAEQIRLVDAYTILHEPVSSEDLMERAATACLKVMLGHIGFLKTVHVFCGPGNNGGDGFVIARLLQQKQFDVHTYVVPFKTLSPECAAKKKLVPDCIELTDGSALPELKPGMVVIDALLGAGAAREPEGILKTVIETINDSGAKILSVDIPSGLPADTIPEWETVVRAAFTVTLQQPKLTFFLKETAGFCGEWAVVDIGLDSGESERQQSRYFHLCNTEKSVRRRERFSHKGTYGHGLLIAGSKGKMGAAVLSSKAALRSGIGLLTVHAPADGIDILQVAVPEAMCVGDIRDDHLSSFTHTLERYSAIAIGPGTGVSQGSLFMLKRILENHSHIVIDADALNLLAENPALLEKLPEQTILTPHPKEFERLAGASASGIDRLDRLVHFAQTYRCTVILKDAITAIATRSGQVFFNTTGNPGMATGGSGDVLTGIVLGLLAQQYSAEEAAQIAVYFHGKAGDAVAAARGQMALLAGDLVEELRIEPPMETT